MKMSEIRNHFKKWIYWFLLGVAIIIVYKALDNFGDVVDVIGKFFGIISPFFVGIFIAYLLYIPCKKMEEAYKKSKRKLIKKNARGMSIISIYFIIAILIIILVSVILPVVIESIKDLVNNIQGYFEIAINNYNNLPSDSMLKGDWAQDVITNIQNINIKQYFNLDMIVQYAIGAVNAVTSIFDIFVAVIVSVYILSERDEILGFLKKFACAIFKDRTYKNIDKYFNNSNEIFFKFIASQFLDAIVVGILVTIAMTIMGIKYAPLLGFFIGRLTQAIWMLIVVIILQQIDANIINPKIVGQSLKVSPLLVIFAITVGGAYFGMLGMFLAVPVSAVVRILVEDYVDFKLAEKIKKKKTEIESSKSY